MKRESPHVAIIILNWNGLKDTKECLESVFKNHYSNYWVYLVDNGSEKGEGEQLKNAFAGERSVTVIQNEHNLGFAEGNNVGIKAALEKGADYIFTLNNDTVVDPHFLNEAVEAAETQQAGIVATRMVNYYDRSKLDNTGHDLLSTGDTVPRGRNLPTPNSQLPTLPLGSCAGGALYSVKMLKEIGLFDPEFFLNYEDSDLSLRGIIQGWKCIYSPKSIVYHKINQSIKKVKDDVYRIRSQRNQLWAYLHNIPLPVIILNLPWIILRDLAVILTAFLTLRWAALRIFVLSRLEVIKTLPNILKKRRKVLRHQQVSSLWIWRHQKNFVPTYLRYFWDIVVRRKNSVME
ncbi:MAG: glycosyltransferase family 2 protein [bacterium]|nr:glycosyltransferase family 2 protein [bacterium]